jgi:hypothetical protein
MVRLGAGRSQVQILSPRLNHPANRIVRRSGVATRWVQLARGDHFLRPIEEVVLCVPRWVATGRLHPVRLQRTLVCTPSLPVNVASGRCGATRTAVVSHVGGVCGGVPAGRRGVPFDPCRERSCDRARIGALCHAVDRAASAAPSPFPAVAGHRPGGRSRTMCTATRRVGVSCRRDQAHEHQPRREARRGCGAAVGHAR